MSATPEDRAAGSDHEHDENNHHHEDTSAVSGDKESEEEDNAVADLSDDESVLSEVDEAQFEDFNPDNVAIDDRPALAIDEENLKLIGRHKRKRPEDGEWEERPKRKKEGRRKKRRDEEEVGEEAEGRGRRRKEVERRKKREVTPEDDETLDPATSECLQYPGGHG